VQLGNRGLSVVRVLFFGNGGGSNVLDRKVRFMVMLIWASNFDHVVKPKFNNVAMSTERQVVEDVTWNVSGLLRGCYCATV
jgi:hypothetical protein